LGVEVILSPKGIYGLFKILMIATTTTKTTTTTTVTATAKKTTITTKTVTTTMATAKLCRYFGYFLRNMEVHFHILL